MPPPPTLKRPRQSAGTSTPTGSAAGQSGSVAGGSTTNANGTNPRVKRRKNEADDASLADGSEGGGRGGKGGASTGAAGKGKEKEPDVAETGEVQIKVSSTLLSVWPGTGVIMLKLNHRSISGKCPSRPCTSTWSITTYYPDGQCRRGQKNHVYLVSVLIRNFSVIVD